MVATRFSLGVTVLTVVILSSWQPTCAAAADVTTDDYSRCLSAIKTWPLVPHYIESQAPAYLGECGSIGMGTSDR